MLSLKDMVRYRENRVQFVRDFLLRGMKDDLEAWQLAALEYLDGGGLRYAVRSGHGVGKTTLLSWVIIHFICTRFPQKTVVTAPTSGQLYDALAAETKKWITRLDARFSGALEVQKERIELVAAPESSFIAFRTSREDRPEALQGVHSEHVLLIVDEASGVPDAVYQAAGGSMSTEGAVMILAGNPTRATGYFAEIFKKETDWERKTVPCHESGRVDPSYPVMIENMYGVDSNVYRIRVLGLPPLSDEDKLIPLDTIEAAVGRDIVADNQRCVWGLDVARSGGDRCVLVERRGRVVTQMKEWRGRDTMQTVGLVKALYDKLRDDVKPSAICVDAIGLGAPISDRLVELGLPARAVNVAEVAAINPQAMRLRDDLWLQCRDWFMTRAVSIPDKPELVTDLSAPTFEITSAGKYKVASKQEMKRAGYRSPDYADALCLTFAEEPVAALYGGEGSTLWGSWNGDLPIQPVSMC